MKIFCLSDRPNKPCYIVKFKDVTIMLDCSLDMLPVMHFMPMPLVHSSRLGQLPRFTSKDFPELDGEFRESLVTPSRLFVDAEPEFGVPDFGVVDFSEVDAILISNSMTLLALPFITESTGFQGMVFLTEPTLHFGRLYMEETVDYIEQCSPKSPDTWKRLAANCLPAAVADDCGLWRRIYTRDKIESCLAKATLVGFSEQKDLFGLVTCSPVSSGYCIGSSNWLISSGFKKVVYVGSSSTLTTHPRLMDHGPLKQADCLLLTSLTQTPNHNPDAMIGEFCKTVVETAKQGGNVLVPCYPSGIVYDLLECLAGQMDANGLTTIPLFFVSPVADASLAYANIMAEWLSASKQSRVYQPEEPFPHGGLVKTGRLKAFANLYDEVFSAEYRQPCVMFCGHPSLRFGDVIHFIELWGANSNNTIVFTEPSFPYLDALAPFQPLHMKAAYCPIDTSLNLTQAKKLVRELRPSSIVVPESYAQPNRADLLLDAEAPIHATKRGQVLKLHLENNFEHLNIDPKVAKQLRPVEIQPGLSSATLRGQLEVSNNRYSLCGAGKSGFFGERRHAYGKLNIADFVQKLATKGIVDARIEEPSGGSTIIHLDSQEMLIQSDQYETHVVCDNGCGDGRDIVRNALFSCLNTF